MHNFNTQSVPAVKLEQQEKMDTEKQLREKTALSADADKGLCASLAQIEITNGQTIVNNEWHIITGGKFSPNKQCLLKICLIMIYGRFAWGQRVDLKQGVAVIGHMTSATWQWQQQSHSHQQQDSIEQAEERADDQNIHHVICLCHKPFDRNNSSHFFRLSISKYPW